MRNGVILFTEQIFIECQVVHTWITHSLSWKELSFSERLIFSSQWTELLVIVHFPYVLLALPGLWTFWFLKLKCSFPPLPHFFAHFNSLPFIFFPLGFTLRLGRIDTPSFCSHSILDYSRSTSLLWLPFHKPIISLSTGTVLFVLGFPIHCTRPSIPEIVNQYLKWIKEWGNYWMKKCNS